MIMDSMSSPISTLSTLLMEEIIFYSLIFFFSFFLISKLLFADRSRRPKPPAPPSIPILGHLHLIKKPLHRSLSALSHRYGPLLSLRFGCRPVIVVSSPSLVEECFTKNDIIFANRPRLLAGKYIGFNYTTLGFSSYGPHWRNLRRVAVTELLSSNRIQMFSSVRSDEIRILVRELYRGSDLWKVDLKQKFSELTLNMMMRIIAGKRYYGESVEDLEEAKRFREFIERSLVVSGASNLLDFLPVLRWIGFKGVEKGMIELVKKRDVLLQGLIDEHRNKADVSARKDVEEMKKKEKKQRTLVEVLLSLREREPEYYTDDIIKGIIMGMVAAGTDTSSLTLEWAMSLLLNDPEVLKKAKAEMDIHVGNERLLDESDLDKLPYLQNIINETFRLYPAGPLLLPHESSEDCTLGGYYVPRGTMLLVNMWAIHRDPNLWVDPTSFKPERSELGEKVGSNFKLLPFGCGRMSCPGVGMAMKVVGLALGTLIQCFEWERVGEEKVDMMEGGGITMPKVQPLEAMYRPHSDMIDVLSRL